MSVEAENGSDNCYKFRFLSHFDSLLLPITNTRTERSVDARCETLNTDEENNEPTMIEWYRQFQINISHFFILSTWTVSKLWYLKYNIKYVKKIYYI